MTDYSPNTSVHDAPFSWEQYKPDTEFENTNQKKGVNTATIWCFAKNMIAKEWSRALGIKRDTRLWRLEQQASELRRKKDLEEKKKAAEARKKQEQQARITKLRRILTGFSKRNKNVDLEEFLNDKLRQVGRVVYIHTSVKDWSAEVEPWDEMRQRNIKRRGRPPIVTYKLRGERDNKGISCRVVG